MSNYKKKSRNQWQGLRIIKKDTFTRKRPKNMT